MNIRDMQEEILRLKKETDTYILAHSYQSHDIVEIADFTGDSYVMAKKAAAISNKNIILCGVRFMAETAKILSPEKKIILANPTAGCPMAEQMDKNYILQLKEKLPDYAVVAYINTTSELKTVCDVCVTSSSALKILTAMPEKNILFIPDINLGTYVKNQLPDKNFELVHGGCPTHAHVSKEAVMKAKANHPNALLLVHPECTPDVTSEADYIGSTSGIMDFAITSDAKEFIIGTETSILEHLQYECPDKNFYPLSMDLVCHNMKATTLADVLHALQGTAGEEITMTEETRLAAKRCIDKMIEYGG